MKLVTQTDILAKSFGGQECVRILAKACRERDSLILRLFHGLFAGRKISKSALVFLAGI